MPRPESAVLMISDQHCGKETYSFDSDVLDQRMKALVKNVKKVLSIITKSYNLKKLHILHLGDHIDGDQIYKTHPHHVDRRAAYGRTQVKLLTEIMEPAFISFADILEGGVEIDGIPGNHGRVGWFTHEANNWDLMYYDYLDVLFRGNKRVKINAHERFYGVKTIEKHNFLLYHGAGIRMYQQIPWYGAVQRVMRWSGSMEEDFDVVCLGHFHTSGYHRWTDKDIYFNGSAVTDDDFSLENIGLAGVNRYWLLGVHEEKGVTWEYKIDLTQ